MVWRFVSLDLATSFVSSRLPFSALISFSDLDD